MQVFFCFYKVHYFIFLTLVSAFVEDSCGKASPSVPQSWLARRWLMFLLKSTVADLTVSIWEEGKNPRLLLPFVLFNSTQKHAVSRGVGVFPHTQSEGKHGGKLNWTVTLNQEQWVGQPSEPEEVPGSFNALIVFINRKRKVRNRKRMWL